MSKVTRINNVAELEAFARGFVAKTILAGNGAGKATVIGLRGELGAGKTAFTKAVVKALGVDTIVTSPTFVLLKKYALPNLPVQKNADQKSGRQFKNLIHIDAYRLKNHHELEVLGWADLLADPKNLIMIEWPEIVSTIMPQNTIYLDFKHVNETTREIFETEIYEK